MGTDHIEVTLDTQAPEINVTGVAHGLAYHQPVTPIISGIDPNFSEISQTLNDQPFTSGTPISEEGAYTLVITASDLVGNTAQFSLMFALDFTPLLTVTSPLDNHHTNELSTIVIGSINSNVVQEVRINNELVPVTEGDFSKSVLLLAEGPNQIVLTAAGETAQTDFLLSVTRDTVGPTINTISPPDNTLINHALLSVEVDADNTTDQVLVNGILALRSQEVFVAEVPLQEGMNTIDVSAFDNLGNPSMKQIDVILDSTFPEIILSEPEDGIQTNLDKVFITGNLTDPHDHIMINGESVSVESDGAFNLILSLQEGFNSILVEAADDAGNRASVTLGVTRDAVPPAIQITSPEDQIVVADANIPIQGTVDDPTAIITVNGQPASNDEGQFSLSLPLPEVSGSLILKAIAVDEVGNSASDSMTITVDVTPPQIALLSPENGAILSSKMIDIIGSTDDNSAQVQINGQPISVVNNRFELTNFSVVEGLNSISITAADPLGNNSDVLSFSVFIDTTPPAVPSLDNLPPFVNSDRIMVSGTAEPDAQIHITGGRTPVSLQTGGNGLFSASVLLETNSNNFLDIIAKDPAGNQSIVSNLSVISDTIPPEIVVSYPETGHVSSLSDIAVVGLVTDANPVNTVSVNAVAVTQNADGSFGHVLNVSNGNHTILVAAQDAAGNEGTASIELEVMSDQIDNKPPVVVFVSPPFDHVIPSATFKTRAIVLDQSDILSASVNGVQLDPIENFLVGTELIFDATVDSNSEIVIEIADINNLSSTFKHRVTLDTELPNPPKVNTVTPGTITNQKYVTIYGLAESESYLSITGGPILINENVANDGQFTVEVPLIENQEHTLGLSVFDQANNQSPATMVTIIQDTLTPEVTGLIPEAQSRNVAPDTTVAITFNESINLDTIGEIQITDTGGKQFDWVLVPCTDCSSIVLQPIQSFPDSAQVTVFVPSTVTDEAGNTLIEDFIAQFDVVDTINPEPPQIESIPDYTNSPTISVVGITEPGTTILITGGAEPVSTLSADDGSFSMEVLLLENQTNNLSASAVDTSGNPSSPVPLTIQHDNIPPSVILVTPVDMAMGIPLDVVITIDFGEILQANTLHTIQLADPNDEFVNLEISSPNEQNQTNYFLTPLNPLSGDTAYSLMIPSSVTDLAGNTIVSEVEITFTTVDQNPPNPPVIDKVFPPSPTNQSTVTLAGFSEPGSTVTVSGGMEPITHLTDSTGLISLVIPLIPDQENELKITATDQMNNASEVISIPVVQDSTAPQVLNSTPGEGESISPSQTIFMEFNESLLDSSLLGETPAIRVFDNLNQLVPGQLVLSTTGRSVTFFPTQNLEPESSFGLIIGTQLTDLAGNSLASTVTINFMTTAPLTSDRPAAPVLETIPPTITNETQIVLSGTAEAQSNLHVLGGTQPLIVEVGIDGRFSTTVHLRESQENFITLFVVKDGIEGEVLPLTIEHTLFIKGIRILSPQVDLTYPNPSVTVIGVIDVPEGVTNIQINGEKAARFGSFFAKQVVYESPGEKTVVATADIDGGNTTVTESVTFLFEPEPEGVDTLSPIVKIIYPENGTLISRNIVEVIATVEEGSGVVSVVADNIPFHNQVGNIYFLYEILENQGENFVAVHATDVNGFVGADSVTVFADTIQPEAPVLDELPAITDRHLLTITGVAESNSRIRIEGGFSTTVDFADENGEFSIRVPLHLNTKNIFAVTAVDLVGNRSDSVALSIIHDDTRPTVVSTLPDKNDEGVPIDQQIVLSFSEAMNESSFLVGTSLVIKNSQNQEIPGNIIFSADKTRVRFVPTF